MKLFLKVLLPCLILLFLVSAIGCISSTEKKRFQNEIKTINRGKGFIPLKNDNTAETSPISEEQPTQEVWADGLTLEEAIRLALRYNFDLKAVRQQFKVTNTRLITAEEWPHNPELEFAYVNDEIGKSEGANEFEMKFSQEFETGGQRIYRTQIALAEIEAAKAEITAVERNIILEIQKAFYSVLLAQKKLNLTQESVDLKEKVFDVANTRYSVLDIPEQELNLTRLEYQEAIGELAMAKHQVQTDRLQLHAAMGKSTPSNFTLIEDLSITLLELDAAALWNEVLMHRTDLKALRFEELAAKGEKDLVRAEKYPDVEVGLLYKREKEDDINKFSGLEISVPLPIFNLRRGEIAEAQARQHAIALEIDALEQGIRKDFDMAVNRLELALKKVTLYRDQIGRLSRQNLGHFLEAYKAGEIGILTLLNAQENFIRIVLRSHEAQFEYQVAVAELENVLGISIKDMPVGKGLKKEEKFNLQKGDAYE